MYKLASESLQRRYAVDKPHPSRGHIDGDLAPGEMPPDIAEMTFVEAEAELGRLGHEYQKCLLDAVQAKAAGDFDTAKALNRRSHALHARRVLVRLRKHQTTPEISRKGLFKRAVWEIVDTDTWAKILARRDELIASVDTHPEGGDAKQGSVHG